VLKAPVIFQEEEMIRKRAMRQEGRFPGCPVLRWEPNWDQPHAWRPRGFL